jgi:hypothetical protein
MSEQGQKAERRHVHGLPRAWPVCSPLSRLDRTDPAGQFDGIVQRATVSKPNATGGGIAR